jgi:hypothetical protein
MHERALSQVFPNLSKKYRPWTKKWKERLQKTCALKARHDRSRAQPIRCRISPLTPAKERFGKISNFFRNFVPRFPENKGVRYGVKARGRHWARNVTPHAKKPIVQILTISNVPSDVLEAIDRLAARQDRSRSSFIRRELQRIVADYRANAVK